MSRALFGGRWGGKLRVGGKRMLEGYKRVHACARAASQARVCFISCYGGLYAEMR